MKFVNVLDVTSALQEIMSHIRCDVPKIQRWEKNGAKVGIPRKFLLRFPMNNVLVVGGGPAGLEAALALSNRSYEVTLADAGKELGGRVLLETALKPLHQWKRVVDFRTYMLSSRANVQAFTDSKLDADAVLELGCNHVAIASGSAWRQDFTGLHHRRPITDVKLEMMISPEAIMAGYNPKGRVMVFDDDHYYLGSALAEHLAETGNKVVLVTPASEVSGWSHFTLEFEHIQVRLRELGVEIICNHAINTIGQGFAKLQCIYVGTEKQVEIDAVVPVTARNSRDDLYQELLARQEEWHDNGIKTITRVGDCYAPGTIAMAVYAGHEFARNLEMPYNKDDPFRRENDFDTERSWEKFAT